MFKVFAPIAQYSDSTKSDNEVIAITDYRKTHFPYVPEFLVPMSSYFVLFTFLILWHSSHFIFFAALVFPSSFPTLRQWESLDVTCTTSYFFYPDTTSCHQARIWLKTGSTVLLERCSLSLSTFCVCYCHVLLYALHHLNGSIAFGRRRRG